LYAVKAFAIGTALSCVTAYALTRFTFYHMGVKNAKEFSERMHQLVPAAITPVETNIKKVAGTFEKAVKKLPLPQQPQGTEYLPEKPLNDDELAFWNWEFWSKAREKKDK